MVLDRSASFLPARIALLAIVILIGARPAAAQFLAGELRALSQSGGQSGQTFDLRTLAGSNLEEVDSLQFSHPGITASLKTLDPLPHSKDPRPDYGKFTVSVSADVPPGRYEVRAGGRHGITNPRAFLVSPLVNQTPAAVSHDFDAPTPIELATIVHGKASAANVDYYSFGLAKGQSIRIDLLAQQIDSRMIGHLRLYDADGRIVASVRGADEADPRMEFQSPAEGQYRLAASDFTYRGGDEFFYQILVQDSGSAIDLIEHEGGEAADVPGRLPSHWSIRSLAVSPSRSLKVDSSGDATPDQPRSLEVPTEVTDWFRPDHRDSRFEFAANKGDSYAIEIVSQRAGQPTDPRLIVQRVQPQSSAPPKLHNVLNVDDSQALSDGAINLAAKDPVAMFNAPETADYRVAVRDLDVGQMLSSQQKFLLRIRQPNPGFDLVAYRLHPHRDVNQSKPFGSKLFRGGAEVIRVFAIRRDGWSGPIQITVEGLPAGVTAAQTVIAANQSQTQVTLIAAEDAAAATAPIRVVGRSEDGAIEQQAVAATIAWGKGAGRDFIRSRLASNLYVAVSDKDTSPLSITLGDGNVAEVKKGQSISLAVKLQRREGGKTQCVLRPRDLPPGVTGGDLTIAPDKSEANYEFKVGGGTAPGTYSLWLEAETKIKIKPNPQALARAQQYRASLQTLHDDPAQAANLDSIKAAIAEADKAVEAAKAAANDRELTVFIPTSNATLRVVEP